MINEIKFEENATLGGFSGFSGLKFDFHKVDGSPYKTVVLAGENGCGKTTFLDILFRRMTYSEKKYRSHLNSPTLNFTTLNFIPEEERFLEYAKVFVRNRDIKVEYNWDAHISVPDSGVRCICDDCDCLLLTDKKYKDLQHLCSYLKTRLFVKASVDLDAEVRSMYPEVANLSLLDKSHYTKFNFKNLEEHIFELLSNERKAIYKATLDACPEDACAEARIKAFQSKSVVTPFSKAFNTFFKTGGSKLVFSKVDEKNSLLFRKGDANFKIQKLSSGEKRIVQLGAMLLTCKTIKDGGVVLVDEPELSMHPRWQQGILKYYRDLLPDNVQLFVATHSEKVVEAALKDDDALVILLQEKDGKIVPQYIAKDGSEIKKWGNNSKDDGKFVLPRITSAEVNYEIFGIQSVDYFMQLYGVLAGDDNITKDGNITKADNKIKAYLKKHPEEYPPEPEEPGTPNYWYRVNQYHELKDPYETLPTYIRNYLSHPTPKRSFDTNPDKVNGGFDGAIEKSTGLLREILLHSNKSDEHEISALAQKCA